MGMTYKGARARRVSLPGEAYPVPWRISGKSCVCPARHMTPQPPPEYWSPSSETVERFASLCKISSEPFRTPFTQTQARSPATLYSLAYLSCRLTVSAVISSSTDSGVVTFFRHSRTATGRNKKHAFWINAPRELFARKCSNNDISRVVLLSRVRAREFAGLAKAKQ